MIIRIKNGKLILPEGIVTDRYLYYADGKITAITSEELPFQKEVDAAGNYVSPGFIDIHVHGGDGFEFVDGDLQSIEKAANIHAIHGTTTLFPTISAYDREKTVRALEGIRQARTASKLLANIGGVHLEGPYFSPAQCGAQDTTYIRNPNPEEYTDLIRTYGNEISRWSYAPELRGAVEFQQYLKSNGIIGAVGHTDARLEDVEAVYDHGCKLITHLYSCTSTIIRVGGFRRPGVLESAWLYEDMDVETIADGCHLPPKLLKMIYRLKGPDHMCLVTDAIRFGGRTDCDAVTSGTENVPYIIEDGVAKLADRSAFAGSIATTDTLVRVCTKKADIPLLNAVRMITEVPARIMGLPRKGKLEVGFDADLVFFDEDIQVSRVIVGGTCISAKEEAVCS